MLLFQSCSRDLVLLKVSLHLAELRGSIIPFLLQTEKPYLKMSAIYLLQDPRARLADMKSTNSYRTKQGETKPWSANTHQVVLPSLCSEMLGMFLQTESIKYYRINPEVQYSLGTKLARVFFVFLITSSLLQTLSLTSRAPPGTPSPTST